METPIALRRLARAELSGVAEIDRTERTDLIYVQRGTELDERPGDWSAPAWDPHGHGEHSVEAHRQALERYVDAGGIARDAGDTAIVVSATPSRNTVRFYLSRGYELMAPALPELSALEPDDVHLRKAL